MLMIGVSTEQNTTNLIPAIQLPGITKYIIIETSYANKKEWSKGMIEILNKRGIETDKIILDEDEDSQIGKIMARIKAFFEDIDTDTPIRWNLGGGQKPQNIAQWMAFSERKGTNDSACYANPTTKKLETWNFEDDELIYDDKSINVDLSAYEILTTFGFNLKKSTLIYRKNQSISLENIPDLMGFDEFREYLFRLSAIVPPEKKSDSFTYKDLENIKSKLSPEIDKILTDKLSNLDPKILTDNSKLKEFVHQLRGIVWGAGKNKGLLFEDLNQNEVNFLEIKDEKLKNTLVGYHIFSPIKIDKEILVKLGLEKPTSADYFEKIVIQRIKDILETNKNYIFEAYANLETVKYENNAAEYDVFFVTQWGTLIAFEAKTFSFPNKEIDARLHNLSEAGGRYVSLNTVFPYDDIDLQKNLLPQALVELPEKLGQRKKSFFVVSDSNECSNKFNLLEDCLKKLKLLDTK